MRTFLAAVATAAALACPAAGQEPPLDPACPPEVATALETAATSGAEGEFRAIRDPANGIRDPMSILDFSCVERLFNFEIYNIFFDPGRAMDDILGLINRQVCDLARDAYRSAIGRVRPPSFLRDIRRLPGTTVRRSRWNIIDDIDAGDELTRTIFQGG